MIKLDELNDRVPHEPTTQELRDKERYSWTRIPTHDQVPSGRLRLKLLNGCAMRQDTFSDTKTITLEDRLPVVLQELELRAAAAEERDQQRERERQERQRRWEQVREQAEVEVRDQHRVQTLMRQVEQWEQANQLDRYLHAMEQRIEELDGDKKAAATAWLTWATSYRQRLDSLGRTLRIPADPEFTPDAIAPFMRGMSPYGPPTW